MKHERTKMRTRNRSLKPNASLEGGGEQENVRGAPCSGGKESANQTHEKWADKIAGKPSTNPLSVRLEGAGGNALTWGDKKLRSLEKEKQLPQRRSDLTLQEEDARRRNKQGASNEN